MEYRRVGKSGLKVSEIGLGCGSPTFAGTADEATAIKIISHAIESGITYIDTAETYAMGRSETMVGKALKGKRDRVVLATKFGNPKIVNNTDQRGSRSRLMKSVEGSLKRLNTDYIDLYYLHRADPETPIEETLRAVDDLVRSGKVRYIGCSNIAAWQLCEALWTSKEHHLESFAVVQNEYNIIERGIEQELVPCCQAYGVGVVPYQPLAAGFLTGKYHRGQDMPAGARLTKGSPIDAGIISDAHFAILDKLETFARERGHSVGELALAWLLSRPCVCAVIPGATSMQQLSRNLAAVDWKLTAEDIAGIAKLLE